MTAINPFATIPSPSTGIKWADVNGALLIIQPTGLEHGVKTAYGESDAVTANIWVIDGPSAGQTYDDALVFPKLLQSQLKSRINQVVLGRVGQGQAKKAGQDAPWILAEPTAQDVQAGMQAWERIQSGQAAPVQQAPAAQAPQTNTPQAQQQAPAWGQQQPQTTTQQGQHNDFPPF